MADALVGATGFVGGNLRAQRPFDDLFRSTDIDRIAGRSYDLVVCAGAPAEKWRANQEPEADLASIGRLTGALAGVRARSFVLVSTVDVYPVPVGVDEETPIDPAAGTAYGRHRRLLEEFVEQRFEDVLVVRLPGLFGDGLKKNAVYDLLHDHALEAIHSESVYQFYALGQLWADVQRFRAAGLRRVNVATEPVSVAEVAREAFGRDFHNDTGRPPARYDVRTRYDAVLGGANGYLQDRRRVLADLRAFVGRHRRSAP